MQAGFIYVVTNMLTGDQYVGLTTKTVARRWNEHKTSAAIGKRTHLYAAIRKYGPEAYVVQPFVSVFDKVDLSAIERQVIQDLRPRYNQTNGGEVTFGRKYDDATKERIRQGSIGKKRTPEQLDRLSKALRSSERHMARLHSEEMRAQLAEARKLIDHDKRIAAVRAAHETRQWSEESKAKLSASCMGRRYGPEIIAKMAATKRKAVQCNETGEIFSCREEAAEKTGVSCRTIFRDVRGETRKSAKARLTFSYI